MNGPVRRRTAGSSAASMAAPGGVARVSATRTEAAPQRLEFRAIRGNMRSMRGEWRIGKTVSGILLEYSAELEPSFWVPPLIGPAVMRRDIAAQIGGVVREIERRQAALAPSSDMPQEK